MTIKIYLGSAVCFWALYCVKEEVWEYFLFRLRVQLWKLFHECSSQFHRFRAFMNAHLKNMLNFVILVKKCRLMNLFFWTQQFIHQCTRHAQAEIVKSGFLIVITDGKNGISLFLWYDKLCVWYASILQAGYSALTTPPVICVVCMLHGIFV